MGRALAGSTRPSIEMRNRRITDLARGELEALVAELGAPPYRARQIWRHVMVQGVTDPLQMSTLPSRLRLLLAERFDTTPLPESWSRDSSQTTEKLLLQLADGEAVEAVLIMEGERTTACLSSQVGCPVACAFCASGTLGLQRNLSQGEILEQFLAVRRRAAGLGRRVGNVVMMGMGEPMLNMGATLGALRAINHEESEGIGARHLTISTVGLRKGLRQLRGEGRQYTLAISLHAPDDDLRHDLIPFEGALPVAALVGEAHEHFEATGREVTFEYVLLAGVNDREKHARKLVALLRGVRCTVNVIPYNENPGLSYARPSEAAVQAFVSHLRRGRLKVTVRKQKGDRILAACGQLRLRRALGDR